MHISGYNFLAYRCILGTPTSELGAGESPGADLEGANEKFVELGLSLVYLPVMCIRYIVYSHIGYANVTLNPNNLSDSHLLIVNNSAILKI